MRESKLAEKFSYHQTLYSRDKSGSLRVWRVRAIGDEIVVDHGVFDGAISRAIRKATPKNVGRSNETTAEQQAILEADAMWKYKLERKYSLTPEAAQDIVPLPMLAKDFKKAKVDYKANFGVDVQPKLDGVRAIARWEGDRIVLISRGGKAWTAVAHINEAVAKILPKDSEFDGEIYLHGKPFQWITSRAKKAHPDAIQLQYHIYDMPTVDGDDSLTFDQRSNRLFSLIPTYDWPVLKPVETISVYDERTVEKYHDNWVLAGYEGAIIRLRNGLYEYGHRSSSLLKLKKFDDAEFTIIGHRAGEGTEADLVLWVCQNDTSDAVFVTRPKGTHDDRRWLLNHATEFYGKKLKVKFFGRTDDGLPRFPIGEGIRVEEDI